VRPRDARDPRGSSIAIEPESLAMPPNDGRWLHDDQRRAPATPEPGHQGPEDAITWLHPRSLNGAAQNGQLLTQHEILSDQDGSALNEDPKGQEGYPAQYSALLPGGRGRRFYAAARNMSAGRKCCRYCPYEVFRRHTSSPAALCETALQENVEGYNYLHRPPPQPPDAASDFTC